MANDGNTGIALPDFTKGLEKLATEILTAQMGEQHGKQAVARLMTAMRTAARRSPDILKCTPASVAESLALCIMTEMLPGGAQPPVYLLPRNNKSRVRDAQGNTRDVWQMELQFQLSFRGMRQLAARAGMFPNTTLVYGADVVIREALGADGRWYVPDGEQPLSILVGGWELGPMERLRFSPAPGERTLKTLRGGFVATTRRVGSVTTYEGTIVLGRDTIEKRRLNSDAVKKDWGSPWKSWEEEMFFKTCVRYWAARSAEFDDVGRRAFEAHDSSEAIDVDWTETQMNAPRGAAALGLRRDAPALPDHGPGTDFTAEREALDSRQRVAVDTTAEEVEHEQEHDDGAGFRAFSAACSGELGIAPDTVVTFAGFAGIDLVAESDSALESFFATIKPGGSRRKALDGYLATLAKSDRPTESKPAGKKASPAATPAEEEM